jgi:hypothetical protein
MEIHYQQLKEEDFLLFLTCHFLFLLPLHLLLRWLRSWLKWHSLRLLPTCWSVPTKFDTNSYNSGL